MKVAATAGFKHTNDALICPSCEAKLKQAHPVLAAWFNDVIKPRFKDCHVSWTYRGKEDQNEAHAEGKSRLAWPKSKHNAMDEQGNPCAKAIDLFQIASNGMGVWSWRYFKDISAFMPDELEWGGNWKGFADSDHYELKA